VPVPRRFDRRPPDRDTTRINDRIRVPEVRLVGEDGKQIGVIKTDEALAYAQERDLDLVEVAPDARPPVCRVLDYSKYKYEQAQKLKQARKHQQQITIREIKFRPKIAQNDYDTKKGHVRRFLLGKDRVKVTIMFRGREVTHPERGTALLDKLAEELSELAIIEQTPLQDGRNMTMMLGPSKAVLAGEVEGSKPPEPEPGKTSDGAKGSNGHAHGRERRSQNGAAESARAASEAVAEPAEPAPSAAVAEDAEPAPREAVAQDAEPAPSEAVAQDAEPAPSEAVAQDAEPAPSEAVAQDAEPAPSAADAAASDAAA
jgi:translation initiation factor IF-3